MVYFTQFFTHLMNEDPCISHVNDPYAKTKNKAQPLRPRSDLVLTSVLNDLFTSGQL